MSTFNASSSLTTSTRFRKIALANGVSPVLFTKFKSTPNAYNTSMTSTLPPLKQLIALKIGVSLCETRNVVCKPMQSRSAGFYIPMLADMIRIGTVPAHILNTVCCAFETSWKQCCHPNWHKTKTVKQQIHDTRLSQETNQVDRASFYPNAF